MPSPKCASAYQADTFSLPGWSWHEVVSPVSDDDRPFRLARRLCLAQLGDLLLVVRGVRPVAVTGRVDDGDMEPVGLTSSGGVTANRKPKARASSRPIIFPPT